MSPREPALAPEQLLDDPQGLHSSMTELIRLLETNLVDGTSGAVAEDVRALRRALRGVQRPEDEAALGGRAREARICLVATDHESAVRAGLAATPDVLVDVCDQGLVVLVPDLPRDAAQGTRDRMTRTLARIHRAAPSAAVGVSSPLHHLSDAPRAFDEATRALELASEGASVLADERWFEVAVTRLRDGIRSSLAVGGPLTLLEDGSGVDLRTTLATWLGNDGDVRATARQLHLHPNSVRYRLQRASQITGIDLDDPLQRLVAHLALTS